MGNHSVGQAMAVAAEAAAVTRNLRALPQEEALALLDLICGPYRNTDAEFESVDPSRPERLHPDYDDVRDPNAPLGALLIAAFSPSALLPACDGTRIEDAEDYERWERGVLAPFSERYGFW